MALPGNIFESLVVLIKDAFNVNSLSQLVRFKMGADMYKDWIPPGQPFKTDVFNLLTALEREKLFAKFLDHLIDAREDLKPQLVEIRAVLDINVATASDNTAAISSSVQNVAEKLQFTPVRELVLKSREVLTGLAAKIDLLRTYKALHDALHIAKMQFRSLDTVSRQMAKDTNARMYFGLAVDSIGTLTDNMAGIIADFPADPPGIRQEEQDWLGKFNAAITIARGAAASGEHVAARQGVQGMRSLLKTEPSRIDGRLSRTADEIDLAKLKDIFAAAAAVPELAAEAPSFEQGRAAAEQLLRQVKAQIIQHANWQAVDRLLAGEDEIMRMLTPEETSDFEALWKGLTENVIPLIAVETQAEWAKKIADAIAKVEATCAAKDWQNIKEVFKTFRQEAMAQFFVVDTKLKMLSTEVNTIGGPLRNLLEKL